MSRRASSAVFAVALPSRRKEAGSSERLTIVLAADADALFPVIPERVHRRDAEPRIEPELLNDLIVDGQRADRRCRDGRAS